MHSLSHSYVYTYKYICAHIYIHMGPVIHFILQSNYNKLDHSYKTEFCFSCFGGIRKFKIEMLSCYITT